LTENVYTELCEITEPSLDLNQVGFVKSKPTGLLDKENKQNVQSGGSPGPVFRNTALGSLGIMFVIYYVTCICFYI